jgi:hypothetical protein
MSHRQQTLPYTCAFYIYQAEYKATGLCSKTSPMKELVNIAGHEVSYASDRQLGIAI